MPDQVTPDPESPVSLPAGFHKSPTMQLIEMREHTPLEVLVPRLIARFDTVKEMADSINIGEATLWRWMTAMGLSTRHMQAKEQHRKRREVDGGNG